MVKKREQKQVIAVDRTNMQYCHCAVAVYCLFKYPYDTCTVTGTGITAGTGGTASGWTLAVPSIRSQYVLLLAPSRSTVYAGGHLLVRRTGISVLLIGLWCMRTLYNEPCTTNLLSVVITYPKFPAYSVHTTESFDT